MAKSYRNATLINELLRMSTLPNKIDIKYQCLLCNFLLNDQQGAFAHALKLHPTKKGKFSFRIVYAIELNETPQMKMLYQCSICDVFINKKEDLIQHLQQNHTKNSNNIKRIVLPAENSEVLIHNAYIEADIENENISLDYSRTEKNSKIANQNVLNRKRNISLVDLLGDQVYEAKKQKISLDNNEILNTEISILKDFPRNIVLDSKGYMRSKSTTATANNCLSVPNKLYQNSIQLRLKCCVCDRDVLFNNRDKFEHHILIHENLEPESNKILTRTEVTNTSSSINNEKSANRKCNSIKDINKDAQCGRNKKITNKISKDMNKNMLVQTDVTQILNEISSSGDEKENKYSLPFENPMKMGRSPQIIAANDKIVNKNPCIPCSLSKFNFTELNIVNKIDNNKPSVQLKNISINMNLNSRLRAKRTSEVLDSNKNNTYSFSNKTVTSNAINKNFGYHAVLKKLKLNENQPHTSNFMNTASCVQYGNANTSKQVQLTITETNSNVKHPPLKPEPEVTFMDLVINYKCFVCFRYLPTEILLYKHIDTKHFEIKSLPLPIIKIRYECIYCYTHYNTKMETINHVKTTHGNRIKINEITIRPLIVSVDRLLRIRCLICNKIFKNIVYYQTHIEKHRNSPLSSCKECFKKFYNPINLAIHLKMHLKAGRNLCEYCGFFYSHKGFKKHMLVHNSIRNYICNICDKIFSTQNLVNSHVETHYNVRSFKCGICKKIFQTSCHLTNHIKNQHTVKSNRKYYPCVICWLIFARRILLQNHKESHAKYKIIRNKKFQCKT